MTFSRETQNVLYVNVEFVEFGMHKVIAHTHTHTPRLVQVHALVPNVIP